MNVIARAHCDAKLLDKEQTFEHVLRPAWLAVYSMLKLTLDDTDDTDDVVLELIATVRKREPL